MPDTPHVNIPPSEDAGLNRPRQLSRLRTAADGSQQRVLLLVLRLVFIVLLVAMAVIPFVGTITGRGDEPFSTADVFWVMVATLAIGFIVVLVDIATPQKRLAAVFGVYLGIMAGLVGALAIGTLIDLVAEAWNLQSTTAIAYRGLVKFVIGITLCYLAVSIVLTTKDDIRLVIPYVEFAKQVRGVRPLLLDTSVLIDGRIEGLGRTGFLDAPLILPQFVIDELQTLADSSDKLKRERGRRGLSVVAKLQENPFIDLSIDTADTPGRSVDHKLLTLAADQNLRILSTDYNLNKVAKIQGVSILNLNDMANELKGQAAPGDELRLLIHREGEAPDQGVGYLPDGTMVVVEHASDRVGEELLVIVSNSLQTSAGRMIFARPLDLDAALHPSAQTTGHMPASAAPPHSAAHPATTTGEKPPPQQQHAPPSSQAQPPPRPPTRPRDGHRPSSARNPRR